MEETGFKNYITGSLLTLNWQSFYSHKSEPPKVIFKDTQIGNTPLNNININRKKEY